MTDDMIEDNSMSQEGQPNEQEVKPEQKPGAQLKAAREREGLSVEEVAKTLYMTRGKLSALENDEYEKLTSDVFIQGYLRKYAPIVGLDAEALINNYQQILQRFSETVDSIDASDDEIPSTLIPKFVVPAAIFGLVAVVLIFTFIFSGDEKTISPDSQLSRAEAETEDKVGQKTIAVDSTGLEDEIVDQARVENSNIGNSSFSQGQLEANPVVADSAELDETNSVTAFPQVSSNTHSPDQTATEIENNLPAIESELKFEFSEDCWIEVRDRTEAIIYTDIAKAGDSIELQGDPPFSIALGNAQAVTLYWDDKQINTQPKPGYRTSRFVVGE